ncbi:hypothetical protein NBRC116602_13110 [Hyphomicrobiales bacterium 4NK60-0047b]
MNNDKPENNTHHLLELYNLAMTKLNQEGDGVWARFNILIALNITIGAGYLYALKELSTSKLLGFALIIIALVGGFVAIVTYRTLAKLWLWHEHWKEKVRELENHFPKNDGWIGLLGKNKKPTTLNKKPIMFTGTQPIIMAFIISWKIALIIGILYFLECFPDKKVS